MEMLLLPALLAIVIKIVIFIRYGESLLHNNINLALFLIAACVLNLIELFGYEDNYQGNTMLVILLAYYCCAALLIHSYLNLAISFSGFNWHLPMVRRVLNASLALMVLNIIFNRHLIAGVEYTDIAITRVAGSTYWIVQAYLVLGIMLGTTVLVRGYLSLNSNHARQRCFVMLLSTLPPIIVTLAILGCMAAGSIVTAAQFMPVAITLMLGIIVYAEEKTGLFKLLTMVPYSRERKLHKQVLEKLTNCISINADPQSENSLNLKQMMREFEGNIVEHTVGYYSGNQKMAAQALGVSEATISRRARALRSK
jgi:DNA-binding protein Fis